jgi:hypothetical protein
VDIAKVGRTNRVFPRRVKMRGKRGTVPELLGTLGILVGLVCVSVGPVAAHHGWSGYDSNHSLSLVGVIRKAGYEHPHTYVKLEVPGKVWLVVLAPPSRMERRGLPAAILKVGETATVVGYPHRSDPNEIRAERITINGKTVELR